MALPDCPNLTTEIGYISEQTVALGGMADVYQGLWSDPRRGTGMLALKVMRGAHLDNQRATGERRFNRETRIWFGLRHINVLRFFGTCDGVAGRCALVSPWMENGSIISFVGRNPQASKRRLVGDVISGLDYLHSRGVIHGDLKGNNILVDDSGRAVLSDFGRAYIMDEIECSKTLSAAAHWTAPEVLTDEVAIPLTKRSDIWSLGMTIFEVYVGTDKLWGGTKRPANVIRKICNEEYPAVGGQQVYPTVPLYLWGILDFCWIYVPEQRPTAAAVLGEYLKRAGLVTSA